MRCRSETILLLEARPYSQNVYAGALNRLGYWQLLYSNYAAGGVPPAGTSAFDAVVAVWFDADMAIDRFARAVANAALLPRVRGALIISPFTTETNARLLARSGAKAWARPPVTDGDLGGRLGCLLHGDRRRGDRRIVRDRRGEPMYPLAVPA